MPVALGAALVLFVILAVLARRKGQDWLRRRIRRRWGRPRGKGHEMDAIAACHRSRQAATGAIGALDDRTWDDLDLDAIFQDVDHTESTLGQQALYHRLRSDPSAADLTAFEALIARMTTDATARERAQMALARLQDKHGYDLWRLGAPEPIARLPWSAVFPLLGSAALLSLIGAVTVPGLWTATLAILVVNIVVRFSVERHIGGAAAAFRQVAPVVAAGEGLTFLSDAALAPLVDTLAADVASVRHLKTVARWVSRDPFMLHPESGLAAMGLDDLVNGFYEYLNMFFLLDANAVHFGASQLRAHGPALLRVVAAIGDIDAAISVASWRVHAPAWSRPRFHEAGREASLTDVRHPLLAPAVPNSVTLAPSQGLLITGSNMSGKSTFLRTVGVNVVLAQTLHTCLATAYEAPRLRVRSCIGRIDDLEAGKSYYVAEVEAVLGLLRASTASTPHLFLFDELFRGTNAVERLAAAEAVLRAIADARRHLCAVATHDGELVDLLADCYRPCHFGDTVGPEGLVFDYRLTPGPATSRNAIALLRLYGAPQTVVDRALARAAALDAERGSAPADGTLASSASRDDSATRRE